MPDKTSLFFLFGGLVLLAVVVELFVFSLTKPAWPRWFRFLIFSANIAVIGGLVSGLVMEYVLLNPDGYLVLLVSIVLGVPFFSMGMHVHRNSQTTPKARV